MSVSKLIRGGIFSVFLINILLGGFLVSLFKLLIILIKIYKSYIKIKLFFMFFNKRDNF